MRQEPIFFKKKKKKKDRKKNRFTKNKGNMYTKRQSILCRKGCPC